MRALSWFVVIPAFLLSLMSLTVLASIAPEKVAVQALFLTTAILVGWGTFTIGLRNLSYLATPFYILSFVLLLLTALLGVESRGSRRWLGAGSVRVQTSELVKPMILILTASLFARSWSGQRRRQAKRMGIAVVLLIPLPWLILRQPDLGSAIVIAVLAASAAFFSGIPKWLLFVSIAIVIVAAPFSRFILKEYQARRLEVFMNPLTDPRGAGYSVIQSVISIGSGQLIGRGLGHGTQSQLKYLPERQTDFIFASTVEELGLVGGMFVILLYGFMITALVRAATQATEQGVGIFLSSCATWLFFQSAVNMAMTMGFAPVVGITLPLFSSGGSSLVSSAVILGLAVSAIESRRDFRYHRSL